METGQLSKILALSLNKKATNTNMLSRQLIVSGIAERCSSLTELCEAVKSSSFSKLNLDLQSLQEAEKSLILHTENGIDVLPYTHSDYPSQLRNIDNAPNLIFFKGNRDVLREQSGVAVVGAREVSTAGAEITRRITNHLVLNEFTIVSGLAIGVDTAAHRAALQSKGKTIAVLANGLDQAQPKQNARLGQEILDNGGAWISEYEIGTRPFKNYFVQRNRIQVGLSAGSLIVEAKTASGSVRQAEFCRKANRPLFAVLPEDVENKLKLVCDGTYMMVSEMGAIPIRTKGDYPTLLNILKESRAKLHGQKNDLFR
ncbi:DNA-processing protein DprA [Vibrio parahaemolyticus]